MEAKTAAFCAALGRAGGLGWIYLKGSERESLSFKKKPGHLGSYEPFKVSDSGFRGINCTDPSRGQQ